MKDTFIKQALNPHTKQPIEFFNWRALEEPELTNSWPSPLYLRALDAGERSSRFGGAPHPAPTEWPIGPFGPLPFVGQLDFAELLADEPTRFGDELPKAGVLAFFYDERVDDDGDPHPPGDPCWRLIYTPEAASAPLAASTPDVRRWPVQPIAQVTPEAVRGCRAHHQLLGEPGWIQGHELTKRYFESGAYLDGPARAALVEAGLEADIFLRSSSGELRAAAKHLDQRGVLPSELARGVKDWILLWQVDSDVAIDMSWGDVGTLYVFIERERLKKLDFARAMVVMQCG